MRVTHEQNLVLPHVALADLAERVRDARGEPASATPNIGLVTDIIACPGLDYCALANAALDPDRPAASPSASPTSSAPAKIGELKIKISGCINACGHHHVGHIGILGVDKKGEEFYQLPPGRLRARKT